MIAVGIQTACGFSAGGDVVIGVVLGNNNPTGGTVGAVGFQVNDPDRSRLQPKAESNNALNTNPDFNEGLGDDWRCAGPPPLSDNGSGGPGAAVSVLGCYEDHEARLLGPAVGGGSTTTLAYVRYTVPAGAQPGIVELSPSRVMLLDGDLAELVSCGPSGAHPAACLPARITITSPVGGIAEAPDVAALPPAAAPGPAGGDRRLAYVAAAVVAAAGVAGASGWRWRRRVTRRRMRG